jgi:hypothetical protein
MKSGFIYRLAILALALPGFAGTAAAGDATRTAGVIELFTSQGCSTCPPADKLFEEFATKSDLVALAYHVDYWDYLGWRDTLSNPDSTDRQYAYSRTFGTRSVYTPQAVINGRIHVNGAKRDDIADALDELNKAGEGLSVDVSIRQSGDSLLIDTGSAKGTPRKAHVVLVFFAPPQSVGMKKGENEGRTITYWNSVTDVQTAGVWRGEAAKYEFPAGEIAEKGGCAVLLQAVGADGVLGPILGAALYRKPGGEQSSK